MCVYVMCCMWYGVCVCVCDVVCVCVGHKVDTRCRPPLHPTFFLQQGLSLSLGLSAFQGTIKFWAFLFSLHWVTAVCQSTQISHCVWDLISGPHVCVEGMFSLSKSIFPAIVLVKINL